ncbi:hypothetical protein [Komagataeibacter europaeus]|uniref:hypothetical protein n=1 Tax=Komagataeibacter europaeus TaxID=33995 RepID=UPI0002FF46FE|nr:hypothetical protein [Komagataeibacter europaeus]
MDHAAQLMVPALAPVIGPMGAGQADEHVRQGFGDQCPVGDRVAGAPGCVITKSVGCAI